MTPKLSGGIVVPLGKETALRLFASGTLGGTELVNTTLGLDVDQAKKAKLEFDKQWASKEAGIDTSIDNAISSMPARVDFTPEQQAQLKQEMRREAMAFFIQEVSEKSLEEAIHAFAITGVGISYSPTRGGIAVGIKFTIGGGMYVKRYAQESGSELRALSDLRLESSMTESTTYSGEPVRMTIDSQTGQRAIESFFQQSDILDPAETINKAVNCNGINFTPMGDNRTLRMDVKNAKGSVRIVIDPQAPITQIADPEKLMISLSTTDTPLVITREEFRYPFRQGMDTTETIITISADPKRRRSQVEADMMRDHQQLTYLEARTGAPTVQYGARDDDNIYYSKDIITPEEMKADSWHEKARYELTGPSDPDAHAAQLELRELTNVAPISEVRQEVADQAEEFAKWLVEKTEFSRASLSETGSTQELTVIIQKHAVKRFGFKLNQTESNLILQHATEASFRDIDQYKSEEAAKNRLQYEIKTFATPLLIAEFSKVVDAETAKQYAQYVLQDIYNLDANGRPQIKLQSNETTTLNPRPTEFQVAAGMRGQIGMREFFNPSTGLLTESLKGYSLTSDNPTEKAIAQAVLQLLSPVPELTDSSEISEFKEFLRSPLTLKLTEYLENFMTADQIHEVRAAMENPDDKDLYLTTGVQLLINTVAQIRDAQKAGVDKVLIADERIATKVIEIRVTTEIHVGVYDKCANETNTLTEILLFPTAQVLTGSSEVDAHVGSETERATYSATVGAGFSTSRENIKTPPEEDSGEKAPKAGEIAHQLDPRSFDHDFGEFEGGGEEKPGDESGIFDE